MVDVEKLHQSVAARLAQVIDPETGVDVMRMRLIEDLVVNQDGYVACKFRPSSPLCPIAVPLAQEITQAIASVEGVTGQEVEIVGFAMGEELMAWLRQAMGRE